MPLIISISYHSNKLQEDAGSLRSHLPELLSLRLVLGYTMISYSQWELSGNVETQNLSILAPSVLATELTCCARNIPSTDAVAPSKRKLTHGVVSGTLF